MACRWRDAPRRRDPAHGARRVLVCLAADEAAALRRVPGPDRRRNDRPRHGGSQGGVPPLAPGRTSILSHGPHSFSFPSGHASGAFTVYLLLAILLPADATRRLRVSLVAGALSVAVLVAATRVLLPVHFLTDVSRARASVSPRSCASMLVRSASVAASTTIYPWPRTLTSRSISSSRSSGPSLSGSVSTFDPDALAVRQQELEQAMRAPGFWDDQAMAARISTEHARVTRKLERYERLKREYEDARELFQLDAGSGGRGRDAARPSPRGAREAPGRRAVQRAVRHGRRRRSTINAGTGGTDAQDWAEMLLRMYQRWATDRGFKMELIEASPGEEAGLKSATATVKGENAYGVLKAERGVHRLVRLSPFDAATAAIPPSRRSSSPRCCPTTKTSRSTRTTCASTPTARAAPAASTSTRPTRPCASPICRPGSSCSARTSGRRCRTSRRRCGSSSSRLAELAGGRAGGRARPRAGAAQDIGFGSQIRSYVLHPYQLVKDHRTDYEVGNAQSVLDGSLDGFIREYLLAKAAGEGSG